MTERPLQDRASRLDRRTLLSTGAVVGVGLLLPGRTHADDTLPPRTGLIELSSRPQNYESPLEVFTVANPRWSAPVWFRNCARKPKALGKSSPWFPVDGLSTIWHPHCCHFWKPTCAKWIGWMKSVNWR